MEKTKGRVAASAHRLTRALAELLVLLVAACTEVAVIQVAVSRDAGAKASLLVESSERHSPKCVRPAYSPRPAIVALPSRGLSP